MWSKQIASLLDIIEDLERNPPILPSEETLNELISDNSNYPVLLEGLLTERRAKTIHEVIVEVEIPIQKRKK